MSKLRQAARAVVTSDDLSATGLDAETLLRAGMIERRCGSRWHPPGCERPCMPSLDSETRSEEGLVGVACPYDPACWPGWQWVARPDMAEFCCPAEKVFAALRGPNDLQPLDGKFGETIVPVGQLLRRGERIPVVWMLRPTEPFEAICLGVKAKLGASSLIVLLSQTAGQTIGICRADNVVVLDIPDDQYGDLALWRALDAIDPTYRLTRIADAVAIFDDVTIEFATVPGVRHVVRINGHDLSGFQLSDLKFLRLLYLAAVRAKDSDVEGGGWMEKWRLQGDEKDHDIEALRKELAKCIHPQLTPAELKVLIKSSPNRDGRIRLAIHPRRIFFDPSLAGLTFIGDLGNRSMKGRKHRTPGAKQLEENRRKGLKVAEKLVKDVRNSGVLPSILGDGGEAAGAIPEMKPNSVVAAPIR